MQDMHIIYISTYPLELECDIPINLDDMGLFGTEAESVEEVKQR